MKLYDCAMAPSPRRVRLFLAEKNIKIATEQVDLMKGEQFSETFKAITPRCTVPALVLDNVTVLTEVIAICRYLEEMNPDHPLLGQTAVEKALIAEWDHRIEMECLWAIAESVRNASDAFQNRAFPGALDVEQIPQLVERGKKRASAFFGIIDQQLVQSKYIAGEQFSMADITALVAVDFASWVKLTIPDDLTHLKSWYEDVSQRPSAKA